MQNELAIGSLPIAHTADPHPSFEHRNYTTAAAPRLGVSVSSLGVSYPMNYVQDVIVEPTSDTTEPNHLASWYAPGWSDGLGDRLLMFDNTSAPSLELLRFRPDFANAPGFETALRERVEQLRRFQHPSFAPVRAVQSLGPVDGLALVSNHTPGRRLSEVLDNARGPAFAVELIRQLTPALATLQQQGGGIAHGALAAERIIVTPEGRLVIVEHVLGSALERLRLSAGQLRETLGIALPPGSDRVPRLDHRSDILQLALVALSLLVGRRVTPDEYPATVGSLLDRVSSRTGPLGVSQPLRVWLARALQLSGHAFESASDAQSGLMELLQEPVRNSSSTITVSPAAPPAGAVTDSARFEDHFEPMASRFAQIHPERSDAQFADDSQLVQGALYRRADSDPPQAAREARTPARVVDIDADRPATARPVPWRSGPQSPARKRKTYPAAPRVWLTAALAWVAIIEAFVIAGLLFARWPAGASAVVVQTAQPADVRVNGRSVGLRAHQSRVAVETPSNKAADSDPAPPQALPAVTDRLDRALEPQAAARPPTATRPATVAPRPSAGIRVSSPIELQVFEGNRLLGSTTSEAIVMAPGHHQLEFVNNAVGYKSRQIVEVKRGDVLPLAVSLPNGRVSVNALPWAEVWIDGKLIGETPLGNVSIPLGEHEIVFRHPQLGEQRRTALVKLEGVTRVTANLQR